MHTNFKVKCTLHRHRAVVNTVKFSPDGKVMASASRDGHVYIWDTQTFTLLKDIIWHKSSVNDIAWSPDSTMLATASNDQNLALWGFPSAKHFGTLSRNNETFVMCCFNSAGTHIAAGTIEGKLFIWTVDSHRCLPVEKTAVFTERITCVDFKDFSEMLVTSMEGLSFIWQAFEADDHHEFTFGPTPVTYGEISPQGDTVLLTALNGSISLYHSNDARFIRTYSGHENSTHVLLARFFFRGERKLILCGSENHKVYIWNCENGEIVQELEGHSDIVISAAPHPSEDIIASHSYDSTIVIWKNEEE